LLGAGQGEVKNTVGSRPAFLMVKTIHSPTSAPATGRRWWCRDRTNPTRHPQTVAIEKRGDEVSMDGVVGAIECHLEKGDALLFVDAIAHGSARRTNPGQRRIAVYRYGPSWGYFRLPYRPSPELLERLTPRRQGLVYPHSKEVLPPGRAA
jgi:hypothetical protein